MLSLGDLAQQVGFYLAGATFVVLLAYIVARVMSFAYFRTKLEYLRSFLKEVNGGRK